MPAVGPLPFDALDQSLPPQTAYQPSQFAFLKQKPKQDADRSLSSTAAANPSAPAPVLHTNDPAQSAAVRLPDAPVLPIRKFPTLLQQVKLPCAANGSALPAPVDEEQTALPRRLLTPSTDSKSKAAAAALSHRKSAPPLLSRLAKLTSSPALAPTSGSHVAGVLSPSVDASKHGKTQAVPDPSAAPAAAQSHTAFQEFAADIKPASSQLPTLPHAAIISQNSNNKAAYASSQAASTPQAQALHSNSSKPSLHPSSSLSGSAAKPNGNPSCLSQPLPKLNSTFRTRLKLDRPPQMCRTPVFSQSPSSSLDPEQSSLNKSREEQPKSSHSPVKSLNPVQSSLNKSRGEQDRPTSATAALGQSEGCGSDSRGYPARPDGIAGHGASERHPKPPMGSEAGADAAPWQVSLSPRSRQHRRLLLK